MTLLITFILGLFLLLGAVIARGVKEKETVEELSIAIGFGALLIVALFDLIPELAHTFNSDKFYVPVAFVLAGFGLLKVLDIFIPDHASNDDESREMIHIGLISAFAIIIHNVIEGMAVYGIALESMRQGVSLAFGIGLHNIPMGMLIYTTLKDEDRTKKYLVIGLATISTFAGGLAMTMMDGYMDAFIIDILIAMTLGMIIYILALELFPHMMRQGSAKVSVTGAIAGAAVTAIAMMF